MPEFVALLVGLTLGASANVAEIVRSGITAIKKGQWEAFRRSAFAARWRCAW